MECRASDRAEPCEQARCGSLDFQSFLREGVDGVGGKVERGWVVEDKDEKKWVPCLVPFCFFCVLLFHGRIKLPDSEDGQQCLLPEAEPACWLSVTPFIQGSARLAFRWQGQQ